MKGKGKEVLLKIYNQICSFAIFIYLSKYKLRASYIELGWKLLFLDFINLFEFDILSYWIISASQGRPNGTDENGYQMSTPDAGNNTGNENAYQDIKVDDYENVS